MSHFNSSNNKQFIPIATLFISLSLFVWGCFGFQMLPLCHLCIEMLHAVSFMITLPTLTHKYPQNSVFDGSWKNGPG